jgi:hypothetical protein
MADGFSFDVVSDFDRQGFGSVIHEGGLMAQPLGNRVVSCDHQPKKRA